MQHPSPYGYRPVIARFRKIIQLIRSEGSISAARLDVELETSPKTIYRDLDFMKDRLEIPIMSTPQGQILSAPVHLCPLCQHQHPVNPVHPAKK